MRNLPYIAIILLLGYIVFLKECSKPEIVERTDTIFQVDTTYVPKISTKIVTTTIEKPIYRDSIVTIFDTILDTMYIIVDYNTKYYYSDTILSDLRGFIVIGDTIYQNRIKSRRTQINLFKENPKNMYYIGGFVSSSPSLGISGMVITKRKNAYSLGYDPIKKEMFVGAYLRIGNR